MMDNVLNNPDYKRDNPDMAAVLVCRKFDELHPQETQPDWLKYCIFLDKARSNLFFFVSI